jgi:adenylate cyclase
MERRLAAIMAADVVGYSRLVETDEAGTLTALRELRREVIDPLLAEHHGRIVKLMGDGAIVEFGSVVDAVACAVAVQKGVSAQQAEVVPERRIVFRIGVNLGDVVVEGEDLLGDGVNVAARLEQLAAPGGIAVSGTAHDHLRGKLGCGFAFAGEQRVKNIEQPVRVYHVVLDGRPPARAPARRRRGVRVAVAAALALLLIGAGGLDVWWWRGEASRPWQMADLPLPDKPSVAVLPLDNLSGDPGQDYFVDGLTDSIITALARFEDLFVVARNSTFAYKGKPTDVRQVGRELGVRYVLEGSVQRSADRLRFIVQLIDAPSGRHVWADQYDRPLADVFAVQDEVTQRVAGALGTAYGGALHRAEAARGAAAPDARLRSYDHFLLGLDQVHQFTKEGNALAKEHFHKAVELDPHNAKAYAKLAITHFLDYALGFAKRDEAFTALWRYARAAVDADPTEPWAYWALAYAHLYAGDHDQSLAAYEKALALNPNDADVLVEYGWTLAFAGRAEEGIRRMREALRLNPHYPEWYLNDLALGYLVAHDHEEAVAALSQIASPSRGDRLYLAAALARLGRLEEAREQVDEVLRRQPETTVNGFVETRPFKREEDRAYFAESLQLAGLPATSVTTN